jgi:folate-dependent phosphoribosylglycinamide formyltransferase PurN
MTPRILIICGDNKRNLFLYNCISRVYEVSGLILQNREDANPKPEKNLIDNDRANFILHFKNRNKFEKQYFQSCSFHKNTEVIKVSDLDVSAPTIRSFIKKIKPDMVFTCGVGLIKEPLLSELPDIKINLHSGITPKYKGAAGNFWPFYFLEPNWAGTTFHFLSSSLDMGDVIHQTTPELNYGDSIHEVACKAMMMACYDSLKIVDTYSNNGMIPSSKQKFSGKMFLGSDFHPEHLRVIYDMFKDNIVNDFLDGKINPKGPNLVKL